MKVLDVKPLDLSECMMRAYEIGEMLNASAEMNAYLHWKQVVENDRDIQQMTRVFAEKKERFEECQRFGHFHPNYHEALEEVKKVQDQLEQFHAVRQLKEAENHLDALLYQISRILADAVSEDIKVPSNSVVPSKGGCGSGGSCSGCCG